MSRFATVGHFTSWLGLCPGTKIAGGKEMSGKTKLVLAAFCFCAWRRYKFNRKFK